MTILLPVFLYIVDEDLYRLGNSEGPRLDHVRDRDVDIYVVDGISFVRANGKGISLLTEAGVRGARGGWLWKLRAGLPPPPGLVVIHDRTDHYSLCPDSDMKLDQYKRLLAKLSVECERIRKL